MVFEYSGQGGLGGVPAKGASVTISGTVRKGTESILLDPVTISP
jgi:hypothetical protein